MPPTLSSLKLALQAKQARAQRPDATLLQSEPIALIGLSCRFPGGADSPEEYWRVLREGVDAITEVPADRWRVDDFYDPDPMTPGRMSTRWGGFLERVDGFDPQFFGIAPREAAGMDPQQRLLLEVAIEALDDAGLTRTALAGSQTGVFAALYGIDYGMWHMSHSPGIDAYTILGTAHCIASGRLSFLLDLHGPSLVVDTGCSSSLVALHLACQSLRAGECSTAVAAAAGLMLSPEWTISLSKWGFMAPDGRCKTFDSRADGFVRGEGCGAVVLRRLADALADGDRVLAIVRGTAVNEDGRSTVLTSPSGPAQEAVVRQALANGRVEPIDVTYVEAHGTGTALGDPIELEALASVYGHPADGAACRVGSVKANIGHLEAAAGMAGLIKTVLALQHRWIPPQLHLLELTPHASIDGTRMEVSPDGREWTVPAGRPRFAGISSFGFGGTNAHVIVEEAPRLPAVDAEERAAWLLPISARSEPALRALASQWRARVAGADTGHLRDICFTASVRRTTWEHRAGVAGKTAGELVEALDAVARGETVWNAPIGTRPAAGRRHGPVFVFSGQGPQWWGMGRALFESDPDYRQAIQDIAARMDALSGWSLVAAFSADEPHSQVQKTEFAQPMLFAMQVALVAALRARGVEPAAVVGHSVGEIAAAHVAGALTIDQAVRIVVHRGRIMQRATGGGRMVSVALDEAAATAAARSFGEALSVAAINAPMSTVLSGDTTAVNAVVTQLELRGVGCRMLPVDYAFHSAQMLRLADDLRASIADVGRLSAPSVPVVSTVTGQPAADGDFGTDYWIRNMVSPVRFADAMVWLRTTGHDTFVEIGPHPVLAGSMREVPDGDSAVIVGVQHRSRDAAVTLAAAVGHLFASGQEVAWNRMYSGGRVVSLPAYPWQRQRYWIDRPVTVHGSRSASSRDVHSWPGRRLRSSGFAPGTIVFELDVSGASPEFVADHRIQDVVVFPGAGYITLVLTAARAAFGTGVELLDVSLGEPLTFGDSGGSLQVIFTEGESPAFRVASLGGASSDRWIVHVEGRWRVQGTFPQASSPAPSVNADEEAATAHYATLAARGCQFGPSFRRLTGLTVSPDTATAVIDAFAHPADVDGSPMQPGVLDACFQAVGALLPAGADTYVPFALASFQLRGAPTGMLRAEICRVASSEDSLTADLQAFDTSGLLVLDVRAIRLQRAAQDQIRRARAQQDASMRPLVLDWDAVTTARANASPTGRWLLVGDEGPLTARVAEALERRGHIAIRAGADADRPIPVGESVPTGIVFMAAALGRVAPDAATDDIALRVAIEAGRALRFLKWAGTAQPLDYGLWFITRGAQATGREAGAIDPTQSVLLGMARVAASERPDISCRRVDLEVEPSVDEARLLADIVTSAGTEVELAFRQGEWLAPRLVEASDAKAATDTLSGPRRLEIATRGSLDRLHFNALDRTTPVRDEVEVRVRATGLNFRDVLNVLGMYPGEVEHPGDDFAGVVTAVGPDVTGMVPGDTVVGMAGGAFATHVTTTAARLVHKPAGLTFADAAAVPSTFMTAAWALHGLAGLRVGERVLIHAATGGVGLAAVQVARRAGAEIFATAGSEAKRELLRSLGVAHVMSSRSGEFADEIMTITRGRGVDVVLNSLSGDLIARSLECLGHDGRFVEIGRVGVLDAAEVARVRPDVHYHVLFLLDVFDRDPSAFRSMLEPILEDLVAGRLSPLPARTFAFSAAVDAFRFMANARHVGKIVVVQNADARPPRPAVRPDATYIVTGAYGAIGRRVVDWLLDGGARHFLLVGRHEPPADVRAQWSSRLDDEGALAALVLDISSAEAPVAMAAVLAAMPPPAGVFHLAGALGDGVIADLSAETLAATLAPKVAGTWNLHRVTAGSPLDFLVLFSGGTALLGLPGQAAYAGANAFLDGFAHYRRAWDLPALSINWGPWAEVGMAAAMSDRDRQRFDTRGMSAIPVEAGLSLLGHIIEDAPAAQIAVLPVDWTRYVREAPAIRPLALRLLGAEQQRPASAPAADLQLLERVQAAPAAARLETLTAAVRETALRVLGLPASAALDLQQGLRDVGLDSLTALELRNHLQQAIGRPLAATLAFDYPTVAALTRYLAVVLGLDAPTQRSSGPDETAVDITALTDAEAEALLARELSGSGPGDIHGA